MQRPAAASHSRWPQVRERNKGSRNSSRKGLNTWYGMVMCQESVLWVARTAE